MIRRTIVPLIMIILGIVFCLPAFRIIAWVLENSSGDIDISGIDLAIALSMLGGGLVVGSAWAFFWSRR